MKKNLSKAFSYILITGSVLAVFIWAIALNSATADTQGGGQIVFFDIGQGDSALINLPNSQQVLVDTGDDKRVLEKIEKNMPFLDRKIEYMVLSHADSDHMAMASDIIETYQVGEVVLGSSSSDSATYKKLLTTIDKEQVKTKKVAAGDRICVVQEACLEFLNPKTGMASLNTNDQSLVFRLSLGGGAMFMGDAEAKIQADLGKDFASERLKSEILKVAHHGSREAVDDGFLSKVKAQYAVVSVGQNSYGHPVSSTLDRLSQQGMQVLRTDQIGDIKFFLKDNKWSK